MAVGDRISANDGTSDRLFVVPELTLVINRVDDVFKGRGPANGYVKLFCGYTNGFEPCQQKWKIRVNAGGKWAYRPGWDVVGWQQMSVRWTSVNGDQVWANARGPFVDVTIGSAVVRGATRANAPATVALRRAGSNDVRATAVTNGNPLWGEFKTKFRDVNGNPVKVRADDRITSDVAPDEDWIVPNIVANADSESDSVAGVCPAESFFARAEVVRNDYPDGDYTWPEEDGSFEIDLSWLDIQPREPVRVSCYLVGPGDWAGRAI
ncbi:MAG: hypothetical protein ABIP53_10400, partial [Candidatus Limnocylindrales bacterium]